MVPVWLIPSTWPGSQPLWRAVLDVASDLGSLLLGGAALVLAWVALRYTRIGTRISHAESESHLKAELEEARRLMRQAVECGDPDQKLRMLDQARSKLAPCRPIAEGLESPRDALSQVLAELGWCLHLLDRDDDASATLRDAVTCHGGREVWPGAWLRRGLVGYARSLAAPPPNDADDQEGTAERAAREAADSLCKYEEACPDRAELCNAISAAHSGQSPQDRQWLSDVLMSPIPEECSLPAQPTPTPQQAPQPGSLAEGELPVFF